LVNVQGKVAGLAARTAELAPLAVNVLVTMVDQAGSLSASQMVTPADGQFSLTVPEGQDYVLVLREASPAGRTLGILIVNSASGRTAFSLPPGSVEVDLGTITLDPKQGRARSAAPLSLPDSARALADTDADGIPDVADASEDEDGDGVADSQDAFAFDEAESEDSDGDRIGDNSDDDDDNDGVADAQDAFPKGRSEAADTDGDGIGDGSDDDDDNDGVADASDAFPKNLGESLDSDGDGVGDNADTDDNNDGIPDVPGTSPGSGGQPLDSDGDGIADNVDPDNDNDGVADAQDAFPLDPAESVDTDGDGIGNNADPNDDNDGVADALDAFPLDRGESVDTDRDGIGNNADPDDDNDRVADAQDAFPTDPFEWVDTDSDGIGNNLDPDDDNDGIADIQDPFPLVAGVVGQVVPPPTLNPLNQTPVPEPLNLATFVKNKPAAIRLGKALFWDMQAGSDGLTACATCHFSAGADNRKKNQLNPGLLAGDTVFGNNRLGVLDFRQFGPNYTLQPADFPLHERQVPADFQSSPPLRDTNDVVSSQGVRLSQFVDVVPGSTVDTVTAIPDPVFHHPGSVAPFNNTRRVEPRNTPTVINAVFNFTNFWDGRANFIFNGENPFGPADPSAGAWFNVGGNLVKEPVAIQFGSLASQAVGPPLSEFEMSARGRTFPKLGRKMLSLPPLGKQRVHPGDSVLGPLSNATLQQNGTVLGGNGLNISYDRMIQDAFQNNLWDSSQLSPGGFNQMEANFSLFWGLAIQLYEATLVSDQTPFDRWLGGDATALTDQQKLGFSLFNGIGNCTACHGGIEFTTASAASVAFVNNFANGTIELMFVSDGSQVVYDNGFNNTGVTPTTDDTGRGGTAPFRNPLTGQPIPLSFSRLAELQRLGRLPFETPILDPFLPPTLPVNADGAFKVPGLRNVALTAPYFHNGSAATLEEVMDFYTRGGNFPAANLHELDPLIGQGISLLQGKETLHAAIIAFLKALTDPRVVAESAPFDHPELFVPEGDPEVLLRIPARDAAGQPALP
jgi:cytochrome c peroxidase